MLPIVRVLAPNPSPYTLEGTNTWVSATAAVRDRDRPRPRRPRPSRRGRADRGHERGRRARHARPSRSRAGRRGVRGEGRRAAARVPPRRRRAPARRPAGSRRRPHAHRGAHPGAHERPHGVPRAGGRRVVHGRRGARARHELHRPARRRPRASTCARSRACRSSARARSTPATARSCSTRPRSCSSTWTTAREREQQIVDAISHGPRTIGDLVAEIYAAYPPEVHELAARSVLAHLLKLSAEGRAAHEGRGDDARWQAVAPRACERCGKPVKGRGRYCGSCSLILLQEGAADEPLTHDDAPTPGHLDASAPHELAHRPGHRLAGRAAEVGEVVVGEPQADLQPARHGVAEPLGEHPQPREQPGRHVEPRQVGREPRRALGPPGQQRRLLARRRVAQAPRLQRAHGRLGDAALAGAVGPAEPVARAEHVEHEPPAVVAHDLDDERPSIDDLHRRARLALADHDAAGSNGGGRGERLQAAQRTCDHGHQLLPGEERRGRSACRAGDEDRTVRDRHARLRECAEPALQRPRPTG